MSEPSTSTPAIELKAIHKGFNEIEVLKGLDLNVKEGENLVILGQSGSGKSVIIKMIIGLLKPDSGDILIKGKTTLGLKPCDFARIRRKMGFLFQSGALYDSMSVKQNLAFPLRQESPKLSIAEIEQRVHEALSSVGLENSVDKMPAALSGGMQKRLGLARTLISKPSIILYDEPTTGLDSITSREISQLILEVQTKLKTSSIIITHDMSCAKIVGSQTGVLKDGVLIQIGSFDELKQSSNPAVRAFYD